MTNDNPIRTRFVFAPPVDDATAWNLSLDRFAEALEQGFPGVWTKHEGPLGPRPSDTLSFEVEIAESVWIEGLTTTPFDGMGSVMVENASASEAAVFAAWLRDSFAPSPELVHFSSEFAMNRGDESVWRIPAAGGTEAIAEELQRHIDTAGQL
ncbi:hypothetical protein [Streptomyces sp. NPDC001404]|uniref:hypothetical protein n=1 Tax=Streptomyces sp. NPDC001404 TaxID=3364571 RepID=UPI0036B1EA89